MEQDSFTLVMSKTVYESELQWGRLVIPGRFVQHFRDIQEELKVKGDYHLWVMDDAAGKCFQVGVKMTIQRPMLIELHPLYRGNKMGPGDTVVITRSHSTGQLSVAVTKGKGRLQPSGTMAGGDGVFGMAVDASHSFTAGGVGGSDASTSSTQGSRHGSRSQRAGSRRSSLQPSSRQSSWDLDDWDAGSSAGGGRPRGNAQRSRRRAAADSDEEYDVAGGGEEELEHGAGGSPLHSYRTGSGRMTVVPRRFGSGDGSHDTEGTAADDSDSTPMSRHLAAIDAHQPFPSEDMEVDADVEPVDMARFDALVDVAAQHAGRLCP